MTRNLTEKKIERLIKWFEKFLYDNGGLLDIESAVNNQIGALQQLENLIYHTAPTPDQWRYIEQCVEYAEDYKKELKRS